MIVLEDEDWNEDFCRNLLLGESRATLLTVLKAATEMLLELEE